jgi:hypothetical protein
MAARRLCGWETRDVPRRTTQRKLGVLARGEAVALSRLCGSIRLLFNGLLYSDKGKFHSDLNGVRNMNISEYALNQTSLRMTLNHRVPGSSPGAPTKLFKDLAG